LIELFVGLYTKIKTLPIKHRHGHCIALKGPANKINCMPTNLETQVPTRLADLDLTPRGRVHPSPANWRDHFFYQLLPDRFSDGQEATRPQFSAPTGAIAAGNQFCGGTLKGIESKLDYLQNLGITTLWLNPPWRQQTNLPRLRYPELSGYRWTCRC
jgi:hypothetical protein